MAKALWKKGTSGNPTGRPKNLEKSIKGMVSRFVKKQITGNKLQVLYDGLTAQQKMELLVALLPYAAAKVQPEDQPKTPALPWATLNVQIVQPTQILTNGLNGHAEHNNDNSIPATTGHR